MSASIHIMTGALAASAGALYDPLTELNPNLYLRADLGITLDGSNNVQAWANQGSAGAALDFTQSTASKRPGYSSNNADLNNKATVDAATNHQLQTGVTNALDINDGDDYWGYAVLRLHASASGKQKILETDARPVGLDWIGRVSPGSGYANIGDGGTTLGTGAAFSLSLSTNYVLRFVLTGAVSPSNDSIEGWKNETSDATASANIGACAPNSTYHILEASGGAEDFYGSVAELFVKKGPGVAPTATDITNLKRYWNSFYGFSL